MSRTKGSTNGAPLSDETKKALSPFTFDVDSAAKQQRAEGNPFMASVQESRDTGEGRGVIVAAGEVKATVNGVRRAAATIGCGVRIIQQDQNDGTTLVGYRAKAKRAYNRPAQ